jgi:hypothetical protein
MTDAALLAEELIKISSTSLKGWPKPRKYRQGFGIQNAKKFGGR